MTGDPYPVLLFSLVNLGWAALVIVALYLRAKRRDHRLEMLHRERLAAIEKGVPLPELPSIAPGPPNLGYQLTGGLVLIFIGFGALIALIMMRESSWPLGLIPLMGGVGLAISYLIQRAPRG
jgi:hypothetical protein